jgi:DNA-binding response OmpR family regulator
LFKAAVGDRPNILVVEDDPGIAEAVVYALEREGMSAVAVGTLAAAQELRAASHPEGAADLVVLDLGLPDGSGYSLLAEWRRSPRPPRVIVLTSREGEVDCVAALEAGADDFMSKPFSPRTLVARVRAVLRRDAAFPQIAGDAGELAIDGDRRSASYRAKELPLTKIEFDLLAVLAEAPGRVRSREHLVHRVWGDTFALTERTVDSHIKALRRKLEEAGAPKLIVSVRGVGFKLKEASP